MLQRSKRSNVEKTRMSESGGPTHSAIPQELMPSRLARFEQMREFFIQMWLQNSALAHQVGARVQTLLSPPACDDEAIHRP
jgi:hypothetical protein